MENEKIKTIVEINFKERLKEAELRIKSALDEALKNFTEYHAEQCAEFLIEYAVRDSYTNYFVEEHSKTLANEYATELEKCLTDFLMIMQKDIIFSAEEREKAANELKQYYSDNCTDRQIQEILIPLFAFPKYAEIIPLYFGQGKTNQEIADELFVDVSTIVRAKKEILNKYIETKQIKKLLSRDPFIKTPERDRSAE